MSITIQQVTNKEEWNGFLLGQPRSHLLQSYEWGELNKYLGRHIYRLGAFENKRMVGAMLLALAPVAGYRVPLNWLYSSRGPTVESPDSPALAALLEYARKVLAKPTHAVALRLEPNVADDDPALEKWHAAYRSLGFQVNPHSMHERRSWVLDIRPSAEELLAQFKMTWRQNVRSAERKGVVIREAVSAADFDTYYDLLKLTSERDAFFIHGKGCHEEILRQFSDKGDVVIYLAEHEGEALAAKMLIRFGDWCWDMYGATANHKRNLKAAYLLQYRCFQWAQAKGCSHFDFRAIPEILEPGEEMWGVYKYKEGYGGFSRLNLPSQDYIFHPMIYYAWRKSVEIRRNRRRAERRKVEMERAARGAAATAQVEQGEH